MQNNVSETQFAKRFLCVRRRMEGLLLCGEGGEYEKVLHGSGQLWALWPCFMGERCDTIGAETGKYAII